MSKVAVVFWSGTGNTQEMADAVAAGAKEKDADVTVFGPSDFTTGGMQSTRCRACIERLIE